jgi:hypothetical protein
LSPSPRLFRRSINTRHLASSAEGKQLDESIGDTFVLAAVSHKAHGLHSNKSLDIPANASEGFDSRRRVIHKNRILVSLTRF